MCTGGGGRNSGRRLRAAGGSAVQRAGATQSIQSVYQGGTYKRLTGYKTHTWMEDMGGEAGVEVERSRRVAQYETLRFGKGKAELDRFNAVRHAEFEKTAKTEVKFPKGWNGNKRLRVRMNAARGKAGAKAKVAQYTRDRALSDRYKEVDKTRLIKKSRGSSWANEIQRNAQGRQKVTDVSQGLKKARKIRGANTREAGYRSRRKSAAQATSGLRIGGSGVNVPGGGTS